MSRDVTWSNGRSTSWISRLARVVLLKQWLLLKRYVAISGSVTWSKNTWKVKTVTEIQKWQWSLKFRRCIAETWTVEQKKRQTLCQQEAEESQGTAAFITPTVRNSPVKNCHKEQVYFVVVITKFPFGKLRDCQFTRSCLTVTELTSIVCKPHKHRWTWKRRLFSSRARWGNSLNLSLAISAGLFVPVVVVFVVCCFCCCKLLFFKIISTHQPITLLVSKRFTPNFVRRLETRSVRVSGFEAGLAVFMCTHRLVLVSFVFLLCLFSALVSTAGCLSPSPSLVLAEALHVGFFFFSSLAIHSVLLSSCLCQVGKAALVKASCQARTR